MKPCTWVWAGMSEVWGYGERGCFGENESVMGLSAGTLCRMLVCASVPLSCPHSMCARHSLPCPMLFFFFGQACTLRACLGVCVWALLSSFLAGWYLLLVWYFGPARMHFRMESVLFFECRKPSHTYHSMYSKHDGKGE